MGARQLVRRFATWEVLPRLRARAEKPITVASRRGFSDQVKHATQFLGWLAERDLTLSDCGRADIDAWHVERNSHARARLCSFLL
ncbi:MAG: hypothetical protein EOP32_34255 [Rhodococcus sp. (in: high G+C Gram-positive bacteria)]|nr:MAG: hypothetical protein EOP32_34255 [Rhodococcus sp. (in: high G+C Gram-positive bacteria)]